MEASLETEATKYTYPFDAMRQRARVCNACIERVKPCNAVCLLKANSKVESRYSFSGLDCGRISE